MLKRLRVMKVRLINWKSLFTLAATSCLCEVNPVDCPACRSECLNYNGSRYKVKMVCPLDSDRPDKFLVKENKSCKKLNKKFSKLECYNRDPITGCKICNNGKRLPTGCNSCKKFIRGSC